MTSADDNTPRGKKIFTLVYFNTDACEQGGYMSMMITLYITLPRDVGVGGDGMHQIYIRQ
jgi:hypothetical protein